MLITLHMFSLSVVCTLNTQLKLLPFKRYTVLRRMVNGNFVLTPTVCMLPEEVVHVSLSVIATSHVQHTSSSCCWPLAMFVMCFEASSERLAFHSSYLNFM